jgi:uncharacterized protein YjbI with pentapeptide repeats
MGNVSIRMCELYGTNLQEVSAPLLDGRGAWGGGFSMRGANLMRATFTFARFFRASFRGAILADSRFRSCHLFACDFREIDGFGAIFNRSLLLPISSNAAHVTKVKADIPLDLRALLPSRWLPEVETEHAFPEPDPNMMVWMKISGREQSMVRTSFRGADLRYASFRKANAQYVDFRDANLSHADLRQANLVGADLLGAKLADARLSGAAYSDETRWPIGFELTEPTDRRSGST